jgi:hypothetical protein
VILSAEEFARLRQSDVPAEYQRAGTEEAPIEVWLAVISQFPDLREWVAHNKTVPLSVLELLSKDPEPKVRSAVASKRKLSPKLQQVLAKDVDPSVRERLACNAKCTAEVLQMLATDIEGHVRAAASKSLSERKSAL